jgi:small subunit ribosomal protein S8
MSNYSLGDMVSRLRVAAKARHKSVDVLTTNFSLNVLDLLYKNGVIRGFFILNSGKTRIFLKYYQNKPVYFDMQLVSKPGHKVSWSLDTLSINYNLCTFAGFYIISTTKGLMTSTDCLLGAHISGLVLLKVYI